MKKNNMRIYIFSALFIGFLLIPQIAGSWSEKQQKITVACVGDSITYGARLENRDENSYPARLQKLLGENYFVENFGVGSCTLIRKGLPTVWNELSKIKASNPDIVIISLGTNDTCGEGTCGDRKCWEYKDEFEGDYSNLIDTLKTWSSQPKIWICAPSPMVLETQGLNQDRINDLTIRKPRLEELIEITKKVAKMKNVGYIDLNTPLENKPELFTEKDGVHPNKKGYLAIAKQVFQHLNKGN